MQKDWHRPVFFVHKHVKNYPNQLKYTVCIFPIFIKTTMMSDRSQDLLAIRPLIPSAKLSEHMSDEERFQNTTLRPIIKLQNDLLLAAFGNYIGKHKNRFYELSLPKRLEYLENAVQKDIKFRNALKGMILGQCTVAEYTHYIQNSSALNKRMMRMVVKRLKDQIQYFEQPMLRAL